MKLVLRGSPHHLHSLTDNDCPAILLKVLDQPLIVWNISVASKFLNIDQVLIPKEFPDALRLVQVTFPSIKVEQFSDTEDYDVSDTFPNRNDIVLSPKNDGLEIPINSLLRYSKDTGKFLLELLDYPWDFLLKY